MGIIFFPKNGLFYGNFAKNKINGLGIIAYSNEDLVIGYFDNGNLKGICFFYNASQNIWNIEEYESGFKINDVKKNYKIKNDKGIINLFKILKFFKNLTLKKFHISFLPIPSYQIFILISKTKNFYLILR